MLDLRLRTSLALPVLALGLAACTVNPGDSQTTSTTDGPATDPTETTTGTTTGEPTGTTTGEPTSTTTTGEPTGTTTVDTTTGEPVNEPPGEEAGSDKPRDLEPDATAEELAKMADDERSFAVALFNALPVDAGNRAIAPTSLRIAFGMVYEGARTFSETEIQGALRFSLDKPRLHTAFNKIDLDLGSRDLPPSGEVDGDDSVRLSSIQQMFGRLEVPWHAEFLDVLAVHYGSGLRELDIAGDPDGARLAINEWVAGETGAKIPELLPPMSIFPTVTGVLINAMYLKAPWKFAFDFVQEGVPFTRADGVAVDVAMMNLATEDAWYHKGAGFEALELPLRGDSLSMAFILPDAGTFDAYVGGLDGPALGEVFAALTPTVMEVQVPRFQFASDFALKAPLEQLGIVKTFELGGADLSGLSGDEMSIADVYHDTFLAVDEKGIEAAAASAIVVEDSGGGIFPDTTFIADRPFLFAVRDRKTDTLLFFGRVLDPTVE